MAVWLIRSGSFYERERFFLDHGVIAIGWKKISDMFQYRDKEELGRSLAKN